MLARRARPSWPLGLWRPADRIGRGSRTGTATPIRRIWCVSFASCWASRRRHSEGLIQFAHGVLPGTTEVTSAVGDDSRAMLHVRSRAKFGPDAPELTLYGSRLYLLDGNRKIKEEQVIFFVVPD